MLPKSLFSAFSLIKISDVLLFFLVWFFISPVFAQTVNVVGSVNAQTMIANLATQIPSLMRMVSAMAYVLGMYFIFLSILRLKTYGESRTMMSQEHSLKGPLIYMAVGAFLIYLPSSVQSGMSTFWTSPNPYGYLQDQDQWAQLINDCFLVIQFVGIVAFIRGLVIMTHLAGHGGQPGTFAKGITHIIGGIFCIDIYQFVQMIQATFGIQS